MGPCPRWLDNHAAFQRRWRAGDRWPSWPAIVRRYAGTIALIRAEFTKLHYPLYWHYDILGGLKAMMELGLLGDPRCTDALDLLESMRLANGWPAQARFYRTSTDIALHHDCADWGGTSTRRANQWVTADALTVLRAAGRLDLTWLP